METDNMNNVCGTDNNGPDNNSKNKFKLKDLIIWFNSASKTVRILIIAAVILALGSGTVATISSHVDSNLRLENTKVSVQEIRKISQLSVITYVEEMVMNDTVYLNAKDSLKERHPFILIQIVEGRVKAGFDLTKLKDEDIVVTDSILKISLPQPEVLDIITNPSGTRYVSDEISSKWSDQEKSRARNEIKDKSKEKLRMDAIERDILSKAEERGIKKVQSFFKAFGFKQVEVTIKE